MASLTDLTKSIQKLVGVTADGKWGPNTASAVLTSLQSNTPVTEKPSTDESELETTLFTDVVLRKCNEIINVFETGKKEGNYSDVTIYNDGGGKAKYKQITYGRSGITQDYNLDRLLEVYFAKCKEQGVTVASVLKEQYPTKNKRSLYQNTNFIAALKAAGKTKVMQEAQDEVVYERYMSPALKFCKTNKLVLPLSLLVVFDSYIHSGQVRQDIRNTFSATTPAKGGKEKDWVNSYVNARHSWLLGELRDSNGGLIFSSTPTLKQTIYRTNCFKSIIRSGDWDLIGKINANGVMIS